MYAEVKNTIHMYSFIEVLQENYNPKKIFLKYHSCILFRKLAHHCFRIYNVALSDGPLHVSVLFGL